MTEKTQKLPSNYPTLKATNYLSPSRTGRMTEGGILKARETMQMEEIGSVCGFVMKMGADAYQDEKRFPNGPYCNEGDWVLMRSYSGTRFKVHGKEFRLINDDSVEA